MTDGAPDKQSVKSDNGDQFMALLMWGISHSVRELSNVLAPVMLMPTDFEAYYKVHVHNYLPRRDEIPHRFEFKDYCPLVFQNLRRKFGIPDEVFLKSLTEHCPLDIGSPGRSGSRFLRSHDKHFIVKTLPYDEFLQLCHVLKYYHQYVIEKQMETLLPQFLSMYRITVHNEHTYLVVMRSVFNPRFTLHTVYDLKGSTVGRQADEQEKSKPLPIFKDKDFVHDESVLILSAEQRTHLLDMLDSDCKFLSQHGMMDYSLLIGIHNGCLEDAAYTHSISHSIGSSVQDALSDVLAFTSPVESRQKYVYFLGIIDILTHYGVKKFAAHAAKTVRYGLGAEISTVSPDHYAHRFMNFIKDAIK